MATPLLSSRALLLRPSASRAPLPPRRWGAGGARSAIQFRSSGGAGFSFSGAAASSPPSARHMGRRAAAGLLASLSYSALHATATVALCDTGDKNDDDADFIAKIRAKMESASFPDLSDSDAFKSTATALGSHLSSALASGIPTDISYGFFAGYFSGLALKKIGRVASIALGAGFLALQTLAYNGYIDVHHEKLQSQVEAVLDRNQDGVVDAEDLKNALEEVKKVAGFGLEDSNGKSLVASGGGFGMGFLGGLRSG